MEIEDWIGPVVTIFAVVIIFVGGYFLVHSSEIDFSEECMREMAVVHCESQGMYLMRYSSGSFDGEFFYCREDGRDMINKEFSYSAKELDNCMIKDSHSLRNYKSKWELNSESLGEQNE